MPTQSINPPLEPLQKVMDQLIKEYLVSQEKRDFSECGLPCPFSIMPRSGNEGVFDEDWKIKEELRIQYHDRFVEAWEDISGEEVGAEGRELDGMIMQVANDLIAQIETAVNFRRLNATHHFAKAKKHLDWLGKGAASVQGSKDPSVLREYTQTFCEDLQAFISKE